MPIELEELIALIRAAWPTHYARGRILHLHQNAIPLQDGSRVHLRVMVQELSPSELAHAFDNALNHLGDNETDHA